MKELLALSLGVALSVLAVGTAFAQTPTGNGAPSGQHYNLNIIGVSKEKTADMSNSNGHVIFVRLGNNESVNTKIILTEGPFDVTDKNGTDGTAGFQLPKSNVDCPVDAALDDPCQLSGDYAVFIRGLGKPGGRAWITTCFEDGGIEFCSTETVHVVAHETVGTGSKPAKFVNVTKELTTVCLDLDLIVEPVLCDAREQLFSRALALYFWDYDNAGLKLAQLRFYELP